MGSIFGGGGGGGGSSSGTQVQISREAPEVESRKLALYDQAAQLAQQPIAIPAYQVAGPSPLEQTGFQQAATTGIGSPTTTAGIGSVLTAQQTAAAPLNVQQFMNPYQQFVTDEITRQAQIAQNRLAGQAVQAGAFGGGREAIQQAEIERARQANIGQSLATGFQQALGAAERQRALQTQTGLQAGQQLGALGGQQQTMAQADIQSLLQAGGVQRALGQQALEAQRATQVAQAYEPYQRVEFLKNIMTNLPTSQSAVTATSSPGSNPLSQAAGAGLGAYAAYNIAKKKEGGIIDKKELKKPNGIKGLMKFNEGGLSDKDKAILAAQAAGIFLQGQRKPGQSMFEGFLSDAGKVLEKGAPTLAKLQKTTKGTAQVVPLTHGPFGTVKALGLEGIVKPGDKGTIKVQKVGDKLIAVSNPSITSSQDDTFKELRKSFKDTKVGDTISALNLAEEKIYNAIKKSGNIPGFGAGAVLPDFLAGSEAKDIRQSVQALSNIVLKDRSGAAVTTQEFERLKKELATSLGKTDQDLINALTSYRKFINEKLDLATSGFDQQDVSLFMEKGGDGFRAKPSLLEPFSTSSTAKKAPSIQYQKGAPLYIIGPDGKLQLKQQGK